ncbi:MAG: glutamate synthase [Bacillota bacterium]|nr:glutamate synthase [Bacillota bacterium]
MNTINAENLHFRDLNDKIKACSGDIVISNCFGQRFIASGRSGINLTINGTPGNALGAYLDGSNITVNGNAQDAVGDTMNDGTIIINGNVGDALGYGMRGGKIYVKGNSGYRTGIHMKEYKEKKPVIIIGGGVGSFLAEYLAGGMIIVLGLNEGKPAAGDFLGTGMHGGKVFIRADKLPDTLPKQVIAAVATDEDKNEMAGNLKEYCTIFNLDFDSLIKDKFFILKPNAKNPYKTLYTHN